jgi:FdrA protein
MSQIHIEVRSGAYRDSVSLMEVSRAVGQVMGVEDAVVAMGTPLNVDLMRELGFVLENANPNDLIIAIRATTNEAIEAGLAAMAAEFSSIDRRARGSGGEGTLASPRTVGRSHDCDLALISVPGSGAFAEAIDALESGQSVMLFSDNVPIWQEIILKDLAGKLDLLVMGPDCGTAIIGGVGLGFANVVAPGPIGIVAASGTGAQHVISLLDLAGVGISHCLGVGGRDLSQEVNARATMSALDALAEDEQTRAIVLISKPPAPQVAELVRKRAETIAKPVIFAMLGEGSTNLTLATEEILQTIGVQVPVWKSWGVLPSSAAGKYLRGLYSGGTVCDEAMVIATEKLGTIHSNIPLKPEWKHDPFSASVAHTFIDFGDDAMTVGRAHPMIDPTLRIERLRKEIMDPDCGVIIMDVVLGHGADPDPAVALAPAVKIATSEHSKPVIIVLIGSSGDPQGLEKQAKLLSDAGAYVTVSNAGAIATAISLIKMGGKS